MIGTGCRCRSLRARDLTGDADMLKVALPTGNATVWLRGLHRN
jgi:hypothetical protein